MPSNLRHDHSRHSYVNLAYIPWIYGMCQNELPIQRLLKVIVLQHAKEINQPLNTVELITIIFNCYQS